MKPTLREENFRGAYIVDALSMLDICICGVGALGSNLMMELYRQGANIATIIDDDRVEEHNISTQAYGTHNIGHLKASACIALVSQFFQKTPYARIRRLDEKNAERFLHGHHLVVDTFDNAESRNAVKYACSQLNIPCLHLGMDELGLYGEVVWDREYYMFADAFEKLTEVNDPCDIGTSRVLIMMTVSLGCEAIMRWLDSSMKVESNFTFTMRDMHVEEWQ